MFQLLVAMVAGFSVGLLVRFFLEKISQKRMLKMENHMLKNHSRILALQQKISILERESLKPSK